MREKVDYLNFAISENMAESNLKSNNFLNRWNLVKSQKWFVCYRGSEFSVASVLCTINTTYSSFKSVLAGLRTFVTLTTGVNFIKISLIQIFKI